MNEMITLILISALITEAYTFIEEIVRAKLNLPRLIDLFAVVDFFVRWTGVIILLLIALR